MPEDAPRDENNVPTALFEIDGSDRLVMPGQIDQSTGRILVDSAGGGGTGTVQTISVATANGFAGTSDGDPVDPELTLSTTITGILSGNGTAISAASTTGSGSVVLATSPTLVTPNLGTPTVLVGTNITGTAAGLTAGTASAVAVGGITGLGTGVATALAVNVGSAGAFITFNGALGTPSSGTVTNLTGTASININGTVGATTPTTGVFTTLVAGSTTSLLLGTAGSAVGNIGFRNATSGTITLAPTTGALGTVTLTMPAITDTLVTLTATQTLTNKTLTSPTLGGTSTFAEGGAIAYDSASSADGVYTGFVRAGTAGTTLAFGDLVYLASADSRWELADSDAATTSDRFLGMCVLAAAADGDPTTILLTGFIRADAAFPALTIGSPVYVGETAGDIQVAIPTGADNVIRRVGYAWTADELYFNPSMDSQVTLA